MRQYAKNFVELSLVVFRFLWMEHGAYVFYRDVDKVTPITKY